MNMHNKRVIAFIASAALMTAPIQALSPVISSVTMNSLTASAASESITHNFTSNGTSSSFFNISGNLSTSKGTVNYGGQTLTQCLKIETATSIGFNAGSSGKLTLVFAESAATIKLDGTKLTASNGIITVDVSAGSHTLTKADTANLFYMAYSGEVGSSSQPDDSSSQDDSGSHGESGTPSSTNIDGIKVVSAGGWNESLYVVFSGLKDSDVTGVSYSGTASGKLTGDDFTYLVRDTSAGLRVDIPGVPAGTYSISVTTNKGTITHSGLSVNAYDRSGYAHYNYSDGVGAYTDKGVLKANAKVIYVTNDNKDKVSVTSKDGTTVTGIGNILNSVGQDVGGGKTSNGSTKTNTNKGIIKKLAQDGTPLVIRFIGDVKAPSGLTAYDSVDYGGSVGDNGYMARMKSGKDVTLEGIGTDATVNGWGFHFMCESAAPTLGKSFEVRNITFKNVPEDCIGMEGVQDGSTITASVERCWIHNCEFYKPTISNPAESDKSGGDGACDFKRGQYFTNSYCYYEGYHKTNLVGSSDSSLQYNLTYHHNYWKDCESRGPLARQANIHMYNNIFSGQKSYCMNPRANAYIFSEYNIFENCKNPMEVKLGAVKSFNDVFNNCKGSMDGTVVTSKSTKVDTANKYANFDTNSSICYIPSNNYFLQTDTSKLASYFDIYGGTMDETKTVNGTTSGGTTTDPTNPTDPTDPTDPSETTAVYPVVTGVTYNSQYHQFRVSWSPVPGAQNYGIAVYLAGKWKVQTQTIPAGTTSFTSPKLKAGQTYKLVVAAKVNGKWDTNKLDRRAVTVTVK